MAPVCSRRLLQDAFEAIITEPLLITTSVFVPGTALVLQLPDAFQLPPLGPIQKAVGAALITATSLFFKAVALAVLGCR